MQDPAGQDLARPRAPALPRADGGAAGPERLLPGVLVRRLMKALTCTVLLLAAALAGCTQNDPSPSGSPGTTTPDAQNGLPTSMWLRTSAGDMRLELYPQKAPITVANFATYALEGFYPGTSFYRIEPGFVSQAGGEAQGKEGSHAPIKNEAKSSGLRNAKYTIAMARTNAPDSATTEFYINADDNCFLDHPSVSTCRNRVVSADGYAVFGAVVEGRDVADRINSSPRGSVTIKAVELSGFEPAPTGAQTSAPPACQAPPAAPSGTPTPAATSGVVLDFITPGVWHVSGARDSIMAWAHNLDATPRNVTWSLTGANGTALPSGWQVTFDPPTASLAPNGTKGPGMRPTYPAWARTHITLTAPAGAARVDAVLAAGEWKRNVVLASDATHTCVSKAGDEVVAHYKGTFQATGQVFDEGDFPLTLGTGAAVPGFEFGLMGLGVREKASLVVPPPFHYGYDNPPGSSHARFNGKVLVFEVELASISS